MSMPEQPTDDKLIATARQGNLDSFNTLVLRYQNYVFTIAYRIMGDEPSASDATQDTFLSAYRKLGQFRGGSFKAWLARIATNTCYDTIRKRQRRPQDYLEEMPGSEFYDEPPVAADTPDPEAEAQRSDLNAAIQNCINALSDNQRVVLVLCDVEGMSYDEAADIEGVALGTVKSRLSRARVAIRRCLQSFQELLPSEYRLRDEE